MSAELVVLQIAHLAHVPINAEEARLEASEDEGWCISPGGDLVTHPVLGVSGFSLGQSEVWVYLLHEVSHVVFAARGEPYSSKPRSHPAGLVGSPYARLHFGWGECSGQLQWEYAALLEVGSRKLANLYLNNGYQQETTFEWADARGRNPQTRRVGDWVRPRQALWWRRGVENNKRNGTFDAKGRPTWRRPVWR